MGTDQRLPLHIVSTDADLCIEDGLLRVNSDTDSRSLRLDEVSMVAIHGTASLTTPCMTTLAQAGVPVVFHSRNGFYRAQLIDLSNNHSRVHRAQYQAADDRKVSLSIAREIVECKLKNAHWLLRRRLGASAKSVRRLSRETGKVHRARSHASLRGIEGAAAATYWSAWPQLLQSDHDWLVFDGRSRRPPRDAVNALLSYLYAVACGNCSAAALAAGLDVRVGFLHAERPGRPALALDLVEPIRTGVVDPSVLTAINKGRFNDTHFDFQPDSSVRLSDEGRRLAISVLEQRLSTLIDYQGMEMTWRAATTKYAQLFSARLCGDAKTAPPPRLC
ncbi:MAG: CRISPR-associated endonuclease Cas1 [Marinosulfonomonas sp.]|nr:CRISPR-associated endonuclease Cas1 [Marinosulfonomonas sp.]